MCVCVCVSVCLSAAACLQYCTDPDVTWGSGRGCPLVVHYWVDLQSVHGLRCYDNIMENAWQSPAVTRQAHRTAQACRTRTLRMPAKTTLTGDNMNGGVVRRTQSVSEYMFVLAVCLVVVIGQLPSLET